MTSSKVGFYLFSENQPAPGDGCHGLQGSLSNLQRGGRTLGNAGRHADFNYFNSYLVEKNMGKDMGK